MIAPWAGVHFVNRGWQRAHVATRSAHSIPWGEVVRSAGIIHGKCVRRYGHRGCYRSFSAAFENHEIAERVHVQTHREHCGKLAFNVESRDGL